MTTRIRYSKTFQTGLLAGMTIETSVTYPDDTATKRLAELFKACNNIDRCEDVITGNIFTITSVQAVCE